MQIVVSQLRSNIRELALNSTEASHAQPRLEKVVRGCLAVGALESNNHNLYPQSIQGPLEDTNMPRIGAIHPIVRIGADCDC